LVALPDSTKENGLNDRLTKAGESALTGALVGGALPIGFAAAKGVVSPFLSNIIAQINPEGLARRQVARAIVESGEAPDEIARALQRAQVQGQGHFTVADALGNAGQRMLSTVARAPGEGRTSVVNFLENRQAGQGRRVINALAEEFDAPETGAERRLTQARGGSKRGIWRGTQRRQSRRFDSRHCSDRRDSFARGYLRSSALQQGVTLRFHVQLILPRDECAHIRTTTVSRLFRAINTQLVNCWRR
jgi:hypothetical protein